MKTLAILLAAGALAAALSAPAALAATATSSDNWAGYAAVRAGVSFRHVGASWTVPTAACTTGSACYSANWIGLGGYRTTSPALEQIGTEADCSATGTATYSAWYELVPSAGRAISITVKPGDVMTAGVTVTGASVRLRLVDTTTGASFAKTLTASVVDVSSAEWIVEAPSSCSADRSACAILPLANFASTRFLRAAATTKAGYAGTISDPHWAARRISLKPSAASSAGESGGGDGGGYGGGPGGRGFGGGGRRPLQAASGSAVPGALSPAGSAFAVTFRPATA